MGLDQLLERLILGPRNVIEVSQDVWIDIFPLKVSIFDGHVVQVVVSFHHIFICHLVRSHSADVEEEIFQFRKVNR